MKIKLLTIVVCLVLTASLSAQYKAPYNADADEALARGDYSDARMYFSEGLQSCDLYSVGGLIWIWVDNPGMRPSMQNLIDRCHQCLSDNLADTSVITLLEIGYAAGIFLRPGRELSALRYPLSVDMSVAPKPIDSVAKVTKTTVIPGFPKKRPLILLAYSGSKETPLGLSIGFLYPQKWGFYTRYKCSHVIFHKPLYRIRQFPDKLTVIDPMPEKEAISIVADGMPKWFNSYRLTTGLLYEVPYHILLSAGIGYGQRIQLYSYTLTDKQSGRSSTAWCTYPDYNYRGMTIEADLSLRHKKLFVGFGCAVVDFAYAEINLGIGLLF
ncbi:MAG: hypothetical protein LBU03_05965 [Tannerellaceae bacterium]|jgi:hypothetical protein|nr:hypothetical protein [Tannerellaceae bacterium]